MTANLTQIAGKYEIAYAGETPWHGHGQRLTDGADVDTWLTESGLGNFKILRSKIRYSQGTKNGEHVWAEYPDQHVLLRSDTRAALSIVGKDYKVVQPREALEFFRDLVQGSRFTLETAGTLQGGRKYWAMARAGKGVNVIGRDEVRPYLMFASSCDGTTATIADFTTVRVVCSNTIAMALGEAKHSATRVSISHRSKVDHKSIKERLGIVDDVFADFIGHARRLSEIRVTTRDAASFVHDLLLPVSKADDEEASKKLRDSKGYNVILALFNGQGKGSTSEGVRGTAWGLLNAVTEYTDWHVSERAAGNRLDSALFGSGASLKEKAFEKLVTLA